MTEQEAIAALKEVQQWGNTEVAHQNADAILCRFLTVLGHTNLVNEYIRVNKWYA